MARAADARTGPAHADVVEVVCDELRKLDTEGVTIGEQTDITTDLNVDSVAVMDLMFELEEHFDVAVPINSLSDVRTVGELAQLVQRLAAQG